MKEVQEQLKALAIQVQTLSETVKQQEQVIQKQAVALKQKEQMQEVVLRKKRQIADQVALLEQENEIRSETDFGSNIRITKDPTPKFETADGKYSFQPFGRVHLDATFFDNDKSDNDYTTNIRRGRFGFRGKIGENLKYMSEMDFSSDEADIQDMTLTYTGLEAVDLTVGHHRPPVSFERNTSSNHNMMIERAVSTNLFSANRKIGLSAATKAENYVVGIGVYTEDAGGGSNDADTDEDFSVDARVAGNVLAMYDEKTDEVLHLGAGYSYQRPSDQVRYRARPGIGDGARFVDTGFISGVNAINIANAELVGVFGPFSFQGEYFNTSLDGGGDANLGGYYAQVSYFLTGETRNYNGKTGLFSRTKIVEDFSLSKNGTGAWELLAHFGHTDLNDLGANVAGGALDLYTLGLNWYLNKNVRLMGNVIMVNSDDNAATVPDDDPTIFKLRAQWDF